MSIATAIETVRERISDAYDAAEEKGATIPANKNLANLATTIEGIPGGGGLQGHNLTINWNIRPSTMVASWVKVIHSDGTEKGGLLADWGMGMGGGTLVEPDVIVYSDTAVGSVDSLGANFHTLTADMSINRGVPCLLKGTLIRLFNGDTKPVEDITYDDDLLVWNFDEGKFDSAKPVWIKKAETIDYYFKTVFSDKTELLTTGKSKTGWGHRLFDLNRGEFRYIPTTVGDTTMKLSDKSIYGYKFVDIISCERILENCEYYNIITNTHFNLFANGILTSCSLNNLYPIDEKTLTFIKDNRTFKSIDEFNVPEKYFTGLRLAEQSISVSDLNEYVNKLIITDVSR